MGSLAFIVLLIFIGKLFYTYLGEDYLLIPIFIFCAGVFCVVLYQCTKNSLKEEKTFVEVIRIIVENFKKERKNIFGGIILTILIILFVIYKNTILKILFAIFMFLLSMFGYIFSHILILLLLIITITLIGIYNRLK
jgi:hypothetical protein